jgi:hypothetical protein
MKNYHYGLRAEDRLADAYSRRGHATSYYDRSRGPADVFMTRGARRLYVQVRSTRSKTVHIVNERQALAFASSRLRDRDIDRLIAHAKRNGGQPAVGFTNGDYYWTWRIFVSRSEYTFELLHHGWLPKRAAGR